LAPLNTRDLWNDGRARAAVRHAAGFLALALVACGAAEPGGARTDSDIATPLAGAVSVTDDAGRAVRLAHPARRIISLLPATTETLIALGAADLLVGRTDFDTDPAVASLPSVGGGLTPSLELIASLRPDLVIAWEEAGTARIRPRLEELGIAVFAAQTRDTAGIFANVERFGRLAGLTHAADSLATAMRLGLEAVALSVPDSPRPSVLYVIGVEPLLIAGPRLFIGEVLEIAGGLNIFSEVTAHSPQVSLEEVVRRRPDVILLPSGGDSLAVLRRIAGTPGWRELMAEGGSRFEVLPHDILHRPGPGIVPAAQALRRAIHGPSEEGS
jgi:ABC-type Fe3+-hydroxamate transport system substrate-binding protein